MADATAKYAVSVAATTAGDTTWVDVASLADTEFVAGATYIIFANQVSDCSTNFDAARVRLVHGTIPTVFDDATCLYESATTGQAHEISYLFKYTQPGTAELIKLQISASAAGPTITNKLSQILAIRLDGDFVENTDYWYNESLADYTLTTTPTDKAITGSFTPNGTDKYLYVVNMIHDVVSTTIKAFLTLYDSVAGVLSLSSEEGEDATDQLGTTLMWVGVPTNAARTVSARVYEAGGSNIMLASRVFVFNLSKFAQIANTFDATEVDPASSPSWSTVATQSPTPSVTGNWVVMAFSVNDVGSVTDNLGSRLQINPDGGGLVSNPNYSTAVPNIDSEDASDEMAFSVFTLVSMTSGAARDINWQWNRSAGTASRIEDNGLVAFSVALAAAGRTSKNTRDHAGNYMLRHSEGVGRRIGGAKLFSLWEKMKNEIATLGKERKLRFIPKHAGVSSLRGESRP